MDVTFACPRCGRPNGSSDGRARTVRCACGQTLAIGSQVRGGSPSGSLRPPPLPTPAALTASTHDPVAARHGLLIDERQARALAAPHPFLVPEVDEADLEAVDVVPPSPRTPEPAGREEPRRKDVPRRPTARPSRLVRAAAAILALLAVAGLAAWFLIPRASVRLPPAVAEVLDRLSGRPAPRPGPAEVAAALEANARPFRACVHAAERGPSRFRLAGRRVTLYVTVNSSGRVTAPRLDEVDLDQSRPGACLKSAARRMVFPPHPGRPVEVRIPLELDGHG
ncbi:MAG TPA: hypothetical protein VGB87_03130 [Vicinamibacteria bacterium]